MSSNLYQVDKIVGYKVSKGTPYYKVHWVGYNSRHDSWEPADNLTSCANLIQDYHKSLKTEEPPKKKRFTRRSMALTSTPAPKVPIIEFSSEDEDQPTTLRRSQRARTPTHYFRSELPHHRRRTPTPQPRDIDNEAREEKGKESGSLRAPEKGPEKKTVVSEAVEMPTPYALRSASARHPIAPSAALSSDEETAGIGVSELESTAVTPRISLYETKVRKRLNELSEMTKKSLSETISAKTKAAQQQQKQQQKPPSKDVESTRSLAPSPPVTRSRTLHARQALTVQPSTVYTRTKLRSGREQQQEEKKKKEKEENKRKQMEEEVRKEPEAKIEQEKEGEEGVDGASDELPRVAHPQPTQDLSAQEEHISPQPPQTANEGQAEPYPHWMQLGWEEVTFAFVILALMIFGYYCFYSESC